MTVLPEQVKAALEAASALASSTVKFAEEAKKRATKQAAPTEAIEKAAAVLIRHNWIKEAQKAQALDVLADPVECLNVITSIAEKAAAEIVKLKRLAGEKDPKVAAGEPVEPWTGGTYEIKAAGEREEPRSEADVRFEQKMASRRQNMAR